MTLIFFLILSPFVNSTTLNECRETPMEDRLACCKNLDNPVDSLTQCLNSIDLVALEPDQKQESSNEEWERRQQEIKDRARERADEIERQQELEDLIEEILEAIED